MFQFFVLVLRVVSGKLKSLYLLICNTIFLSSVILREEHTSSKVICCAIWLQTWRANESANAVPRYEYHGQALGSGLLPARVIVYRLAQVLSTLLWQTFHRLSVWLMDAIQLFQVYKSGQNWQYHSLSFTHL